MRRRITGWEAILCLGLLALGGGDACAAESPDQKAVRQRRLGLHKAVKACDLKAVQRFLDPSVVLKTQDGAVVARNADEVLQFYSRMFSAARGLQQTVEIEKIVVNGTVARLTATEKTTFRAPDGTGQHIQGRYLQTWKKTRGRWMLTEQRTL